MRCKSLGRTSKYVRRGDCTGTTAQQSTCMQKYSAKSGPSNPSPGYMPKKKNSQKTFIHKDICAPQFIGQDI